MNGYLLAAAVLSTIIWGLHTFAGGPVVAKPLLESDLDPVAKYTNYYCWHIVTIVLLAMPVSFALAAFRPESYELAVLMTMLAGAATAWSLALVGGWHRKPWDLPQWFLFIPVVVVGAIGIWPNDVAKAARIDASGLTVALSASGPFDYGSPIEIEMTVHNPTDSPKTFCVHHTPFEGLRSDIFSVSASIADVEYRGVMAKRAPPGPEDYVVVKPGESKRAKVDLTAGYDVKPGAYAVSYRGTDISGLPMAGPVSVAVREML